MLAALAALSGTKVAQAGVIEASFAGIVTGSNVITGPGPAGNINGDLVTGTFSASDAGCSVAFGFCAGDVSITFDVARQKIVYGPGGGDGGSIFVSNTPGSQTVTLEPQFDPYYNADLYLTGAANAFINGTEYATLQLGSIESASARFMDGRDLQAEISFTSIDGIPIPEPTSLAVLLAGLGSLMIASNFASLGRLAPDCRCNRWLGYLPYRCRAKRCASWPGAKGLTPVAR